MNYILSVKIFLVSVFLECVWGKECYKAVFTDSILSCDDFKNEDIQADGIKLGMTDGSDTEDPGFGLSGPLVLNCPIDDSHSVNMNIFKSTELGEEYMFKSAVNLCDSLDDTDTPWWPIFQMMNISVCPIEPGEYHIKNLVLSIDAFSDLLCRDFCGEYCVELSLGKELEKISCHIIQVAVEEYECEDDCEE